MPLTIGGVAQRAGVTRDAIRYYERLGVIPKPARTRAGYRVYGDAVIHRLAIVRNAQRFGFSLRQIAEFLSARDRGARPCREVRAAAQQMLDAADRQIAALSAARREMRRTLDVWDRELAATPPGLPARLLERLPPAAGGPTRRPRRPDRSSGR